MKDDNKGIILVVVSMTIFAVQDILIKFLSADISMFQILFCRSVIGVLLICTYLKLSHKPLKFGTAYPFLSSCRLSTVVVDVTVRDARSEHRRLIPLNQQDS